jgi:hypothetical protein
MFEAEASKTKNLLSVRYSGRVGPDETERYKRELPTLLNDLKPGFRLLTDMTSLEEMDVACEPHLKGMMDLCNQKGVDLVVRVIPDPHKDIGLSIMSLFHYHPRVRIVTCTSIDEAAKVLA